MRSTANTVLLLVILPMMGCASSTAIIQDPGRLIGRPRPVTSVGKIITLWEAADGADIDGMPARGFAGQIMFFNVDESPVKVDGKVVIYQYDRYDEAAEDSTPIHSFTFEPEAWNVHCSEGTLGHTYSVFVPYMRKHKESVNCGLRVEFYCADGRRVSSGITPILLHGKKSSGTANTMSGLQRTEIVNKVRGGPNDDSFEVYNASSTRVAEPRPIQKVTIPLQRR